MTLGIFLDQKSFTSFTSGGQTNIFMVNSRYFNAYIGLKITTMLFAVTFLPTLRLWYENLQPMDSLMVSTLART